MGEKRVGVILTYEADRVPLYPEVKTYLQHADVLLDVGPGVRPQRFVSCRRHVCLEAHGEYCNVLRANGFETIQAEVPAGLADIEIPIDTAVAIDVVEHLTREDGLAMIAEMVRLARQQVLIFTPLGFMPQDGGKDADPWGYQGQRWQVHRSGWTPADFPGWRCFVDEHFHRVGDKYFGAFFAIWDKKK